jgi:DNA-directed RNA polymerase specialized sigma24 family protein
MAITTLTFDTGASQPIEPTGSRTTSTFGRAFKVLQPVDTLQARAPGKENHFRYDLGPERIVNTESAVTTCTYFETGPVRHGVICYTIHAGCQNPPDDSLEDKLVTKILALLDGPVDGERPSWWFVWSAIVEDPWFGSQQREIVGRYIHHQYEAEDVNQNTTIDLAKRLQQSPTLGIGPEELKLKFLKKIRIIIFRNLDKWRQNRSREKRRLSGMPVEQLADESNRCLSDIIEINAALNSLDYSEERDVIQMRLNGYFRSHVANELGLSFDKVDRRYRAAKEMLRRDLRDFRID